MLGFAEEVKLPEIVENADEFISSAFLLAVADSFWTFRKFEKIKQNCRALQKSSDNWHPKIAKKTHSASLIFGEQKQKEGP